MTTLSRRAAIVGVAESDLGRVPGKTPLGLIAQATTRALDDAGLSKREIDAVFSAGIPSIMPSSEVAEYLGIRPRYTDSTSVGGASFEVHAARAAMGLAHGLFEVALIAYGSTQLSDQNRRAGGRVQEPFLPGVQFEVPYGLLLPLGPYALAAQRHMYEYGTTSDQLACIAVSTRQWAARNPVAFMREPITVDDVLASPLIASPLRRLDCCLVTDGGGAVLMTTADRARSLRKPPVLVLGWGEHYSHSNAVLTMADLTVTPAAHSGPPALEMAGVRLQDLDVIEIYDSFTITVLMTLEDLGFCRKGEGGAFVESTGMGPGGEFPLNTSGGGLSYCHPGMYGIFLLVEATRQLRAEAGERQVAGARTALCHGTGGVLSSGCTIILARD